MHRVRRWLHRHLREEDLGRAGIAVGLSLLTVLAVVVAGLQGQASIEAQRGNREAQRIGLQATGDDATAVIQVGTAYGTYRRWFEQIERSTWATDQLTRDPNSPDKAALQILKDADRAIADWTATQSKLFTSQYKTADSTNFTAFITDSLDVPAARSALQRAVEQDVASIWDAKASDYVTVLTVVAVGLFMLGLASTVRRRTRPILAGAGILFGIVSLAWAISIALAPVHRVPQAAVDQLVASEGALDRASGAEGQPELAAADRRLYQQAIDQATAAIATDPSYLAAYLARAKAQVFYGDAITFTSGPSDESRGILAAGAADYRTYLADHPDDYAAWWNLGWANLLVGDPRASVDATNQALIRAPGQFTLYLNRALAFLEGGDSAQAQADVDEAIDRAALDSSDSANWYLGQSDFDIARLAADHPDETTFLRTVQTRLREAQVSLRVRGVVTPSADAPQLGSVTVTPVQINRYDGTTQVGAALTDGGHVPTTDAVGVRVSLAGLGALKGRTVSGRIWLDGLPRPEYTRDVTVDGDSLDLNLVSPYGLAGFDLDPGAYQLDVYVDGARRFQTSWIVDPRPDQPQYAITASPLLAAVQADGLGCDPPTLENGESTVNCSVRDSDDSVFIVDVSYDAKDRITYVVMTVLTASSNTTANIDEVAAPFTQYVIDKLYPPDLADRALAFISDEKDRTDEHDVGGTTIRTFGADAHTRNVDIRSPWQ